MVQFAELKSKNYYIQTTFFVFENETFSHLKQTYFSYLKTIHFFFVFENCKIFVFVSDLFLLFENRTFSYLKKSHFSYFKETHFRIWKKTHFSYLRLTQFSFFENAYFKILRFQIWGDSNMENSTFEMSSSEVVRTNNGNLERSVQSFKVSNMRWQNKISDTNIRNVNIRSIKCRGQGQTEKIWGEGFNVALRSKLWYHILIHVINIMSYLWQITAHWNN